MRTNRLLGVVALVLLLTAGIWFITSSPVQSPVESAAQPDTVAARGRAPVGSESGAPTRREDPGPVVSDPVVPVLSRPVSSLTAVSGSTPTLNRELNPRQNPETFLEGPVELENGGRDVLADFGVNGGTSPTPTLVFEGISYAEAGDGFPPDTIGDVGPDHYVQAINVAFQVFDKQGNSLGGPYDIGDLWETGICAGLEFGDPVVTYDELADRWSISQFYSNGICMAVSTGPDPLGTYYLYNFNTPDFPDYFKISVWPNAYYMGANESSYTAYAINRPAMLAGQPTTTIRFSGEDNLLLPADVDGSTPPAADAPGLFYTFKDNSFHGGSDRLEIFQLDPDFVTPANSTFTLVTTIPVSPYTYTVCGFFNFNCIRQPGTTQRIDAVSEWPMWRLAYRNFGTHEALVGNFAVDVGNEVAGIRWFELRRASGDTQYSLYQEGTYAPDGDSRFMGSIAMDQNGNIALGYNVSSTTTYPSLRYAVRTTDEPAGTLRTEAVMMNGNASQTNINRWGDYAAMSVDPEDGCTFWFTGEMMPPGGTTWTTYIGSFAIPECSSPTAVTLTSLDASAETPVLWLGAAAALLALAGVVIAVKR